MATIPHVEHARPEQTFAEFVRRERERLAKQREEALSRRADIDNELEDIERELAGIEAYEAAKQGRFPTAQPRRRTTGQRAPRGEGAKRRDEIYNLIREKYEGGVTAAELNTELGATDQKDKQGIAAALSALKKDGKLRQDQRRGPYVPT